jgi:hypothetical protein
MGFGNFARNRALNIEFRKVLEFIWSIVTRLKFSKAFSLIQNVKKFHYFTKRTLDNLEKDKIKYVWISTLSRSKRAEKFKKHVKQKFFTNFFN